jgi:hypothetical protein
MFLRQGFPPHHKGRQSYRPESNQHQSTNNSTTTKRVPNLVVLGRAKQSGTRLSTRTNPVGAATQLRQMARSKERDGNDCIRRRRAKLPCAAGLIATKNTICSVWRCTGISIQENRAPKGR